MGEEEEKEKKVEIKAGRRWKGWLKLGEEEEEKEKVRTKLRGGKKWGKRKTEEDVVEMRIR